MVLESILTSVFNFCYILLIRLYKISNFDKTTNLCKAIDSNHRGLIVNFVRSFDFERVAEVKDFDPHEFNGSVLTCRERSLSSTLVLLQK